MSEVLSDYSKTMADLPLHTPELRSIDPLRNSLRMTETGRIESAVAEIMYTVRESERRAGTQMRYKEEYTRRSQNLVLVDFSDVDRVISVYICPFTEQVKATRPHR